MVAGATTPDSGRWSRREVLKWTIRIAYGTFAAAFALPALALRTLSIEQQAVGVGEPLVYAVGPQAGQPVKADDLKVGTAAQAFPQGKRGNQSNLIELVRIGAGAEGLVAFSAICTHLGCTVHERLDPRGLIACPCHGSYFDPKTKAGVVGGPASRPLPALPVVIGPDGVVAANGPFEGPVGPG